MFSGQQLEEIVKLVLDYRDKLKKSGVPDIEAIQLVQSFQATLMMMVAQDKDPWS